MHRNWCFIAQELVFHYSMNKKELCYILIVVVMGVSLLLGFAVEVFGIDLGQAEIGRAHV